MSNCRSKSSCKNGLPTQRLNSSQPADQYQRQKIIQRTVRVAPTLYTMNLGALSTYQNPDDRYQVNWNQMSDRKEAHIQLPGASGTNPGANSTKRTITRMQPGALSPGGEGVDIKHNSYVRYLNRLKGKGPLKQEKTPKTFGDPIIFSLADPIYGGKTFKTGIVAGCVCEADEENDRRLYNNTVCADLNHVLFSPEAYVNEENCICPSVCQPPKNQFYGYVDSDSFYLECTRNAACGDIIPVL